MIPPLSPLPRVMTRPLTITPSYSMKIFAVKIYVKCSKTVKLVKFTAVKDSRYTLGCVPTVPLGTFLLLFWVQLTVATLLTLILPQTENENTMKRRRHDVSSSPNVSYIFLKVYITFKYWMAMFSI